MVSQRQLQSKTSAAPSAAASSWQRPFAPESDSATVDRAPNGFNFAQLIQPKLAIGSPGDAYEQEADRMAAQVMSMPDPQTTAGATVQTKIQPKRFVQAKGDGTEASADLESQLAAQKGGGQPLPESVRSFMEPRFGADFSHVRVHTGSTAIQMNRDLGAQAFTHGSDIFFGAGKSPANSDLTAHELTHVVQQTGGVQAKQSLDSSVQRLTDTYSPKVIQRSEVCDEEGVCQSVPDPAESSASNVVTLPEIVIEGDPSNSESTNNSGAGGAPSSHYEGGSEGASGAEHVGNPGDPEALHKTLDLVGLIPGIGEFADAANAALYLSEGRYEEAALSVAATIPVLGMAATGTKALLKGGAKEAAEAGVKVGGKEATEAGVKTVGKEATEVGIEKSGKEAVESEIDQATQVADGVGDAAKVAEETGNVGHNAAEFEKFKARLAAEEIEGAPATGSALKLDSQHRSASWAADTVAEEGKHFSIKGGDGKTVNLSQVEGNVNGQNGIFEYIVDEKGNLVHQRFIPEGKPIGSRNQSPEKLNKWTEEIYKKN